MANKNIIAIAVMDIIGIIVIITIPIMTLLAGFSNYGTIDDSLTFYYLSDAVSPKENLSFYADVNKLTVEYIKTPVDYDIKIEVNIEARCRKLILVLLNT